MTTPSKPYADRAAWILADPRRLPEGVDYCHELGGIWWPDWEKQLLLWLYAYFSPDLLSAGVRYAREILSDDWPELEPFLPSIPARLEEYLGIKPGPQIRPVLEKAMLEAKGSCSGAHARAVYLYASMAIQGRWELGEWLILEATRPVFSDHLSDELTAVTEVAEDYREFAFPQKAWPELIEMIRAGDCDPQFAVDYCLKSRIDCKAEVAEGLLNARVWDDDDTFQWEKRGRLACAAEVYAELVIKGRWEAGEKLLSGFPFEMRCYAQNVLKHPLPDQLHKEMLMNSFETPDDPDIKEYVKWCGKQAAVAEGGAQ
jgi:hypothetical protein